jgi:hypothetical protein
VIHPHRLLGLEPGKELGVSRHPRDGPPVLSAFVGHFHRAHEFLLQPVWQGKTDQVVQFFKLVAQIGHDTDDWPLVIAKELVDNALDACENADVPFG